MHKEYTVSIITVNYNGLACTCPLLDSLADVDEQTEVIVVDNASLADEASAIASRYPRVKVVRSRRNLGFAGGNNLGFRHSSGRYVFFVNNDTVFDPRGLRHLVERIESSPSTAIVCPKLTFHFDRRTIQYAGYTPLSAITLRNKSIGFGETDRGQYDTARPTPYAHGAAMLVRRDAILKAGLMPECYFLYYEELDWSMMMRRHGYDIWYEPRCTVYHKESRTTGSGSPLRTYYLSRNRLLFAKRNVGQAALLPTLAYLLCIVAVKEVLSHLAAMRFDLAKAVIKGNIDFFRL